MKNLPFFVYGTLRDDDYDNPNPYAPEWLKHHSIACDAKAKGFKMYGISWTDGNYYPFSIRTNNPNDCINGRLLRWNDKLFQKKLTFADFIESYDSKNPTSDKNIYIRDIIDVEIIGDGDIIKPKNKVVKAIIYYQRLGTTPLDKCDVMPNQNWLDRDKSKHKKKLSKL